MRIEWTEPALVDLEAIRNYIAKDSRYYANRFIERIFDAVAKLEDFPEMGRHVPEAEREDIRELIFQSYRIIYRIGQHRVDILTVLHGSRDLTRQTVKPWEIT